MRILIKIDEMLDPETEASAEIFSIVCFNSKDAVLADVWKVLDALLIEVRQGSEVSNAFVDKTKHRRI